MQKSTDFIDLVADRYRQTHRAVTIAFVLLFVAIMALVGKSAADDVRNRVFLRDSGQSVAALVTAKDQTTGKGSTQWFDYQFSARDPNGAAMRTYKGNNEVSLDHYRQYAVGAQVPVRFDPRNPKNNHTDMSGRWQTSDLVTDAIFQVLLIALPLGFLTLLLWMFVGWLIGLMAPKPAAEFPANFGSAPVPAPPEPTPLAVEIAAYSRFLMIGSGIVGVLVAGSVVATVLAHPKSDVFSPPMILWIVGMIAAWTAVIIVRARRLRAHIKGR